MAEAPVAPAPAAPAAPSAPAAAPSAPAPAAPSTSAAPATPAPAAAAPAPAATPAAAPSATATPAKYDPKTSTEPPKSSDYENTQEGLSEFIKANTEWSQSHPEEAQKRRDAKLAAEESGQPVPPEGSVAEQVKAAEGEAPKDAPKPAEGAVAPATPAAIEEWSAKSPELKAAFDKDPALKASVMEMARGYEEAQKVLDVVSTPEEAQFAMEHANRLVSLQTNWMLSAEDPEMVKTAWDQTVEMFKERDKDGKEILENGKPKLGADFKPFVRTAAQTAIDDVMTPYQTQITALEQKLKGVYPTEEAKEADEKQLEDLNYTRDALKYVSELLKRGDPDSELPALPANATPEQIKFQERLKQEQEKLDASKGKQSTADRKAATKILNAEVQKNLESNITQQIDTRVGEMKARGEYLPEFVLSDKWVNPASGKVTALSSFNVKIYFALTEKINKLHGLKLASLEALGAAGKDARNEALKGYTAKYLPKIFDAEVKRIQDGIRSMDKPKPPGTVTENSNNAGAPRREPESTGTTTPQAMTKEQTRAWAEAEAKKDPNWDSMERMDQETLVMRLAAKKRFGG